MQAVGLIAEFNPLHNGHVHALATAKRLAAADVAVVVMSGNYVQRGEPALMTKWARTEAALAAGADLVVELPVTSVIQAASGFAAGAIQLLAGLQVPTLAFGTASPSVDYLGLARRLGATQADHVLFQDYTQTYATQLNRAATAVTGVALDDPNLLLGLSYAQAIVAQAVPMAVLPFARVGVQHDQATAAGSLASASAVRARVAAGESVARFVPPATQAALGQARLQSWTDLFGFLRYRLQTAGLEALRQVTGMSEGLEYRLTEQLGTVTDFAGFLTSIKSKRYTYARLRRLCLAVVLNLTQTTVTAAARRPYAHVLGFTSAGQTYLHQIKKTTAVPLVTRVSQAMLAPGGLMAAQQQADALIATLTGTEQNYGRVPLRHD